ncbi:MAG TPA: hypothetical protein VN456_05920 [Desulfosporosinus sp.]|nr:hypothetical protein [Desulfosporosinus sp.]
MDQEVDFIQSGITSSFVCISRINLKMLKDSRTSGSAELKDKYSKRSTLFRTSATTEEIEDALFYLSRIEALKIEGGFMVVYNALTIERLGIEVEPLGCIFCTAFLRSSLSL